MTFFVTCVKILGPVFSYNYSIIGMVIATGYGLNGQCMILERGKRFALLQSVQTGTGAHTVSYEMGTGTLSPVIKRPGSEADNSLPSSAEVKNGAAILPFPHMPSWHSA
jgi:hypothetical protein